MTGPSLANLWHRKVGTQQAGPHHGRHYVACTMDHTSRSSERESHSGITCDMVRAYVAQVGVAQAVTMAESAGITSAEKGRAKRCLAQKS